MLWDSLNHYQDHYYRPILPDLNHKNTQCHEDTHCNSCTLTIIKTILRRSGLIKFRLSPRAFRWPLCCQSWLLSRLWSDKRGREEVRLGEIWITIVEGPNCFNALCWIIRCLHNEEWRRGSDKRGTFSHLLPSTAHTTAGLHIIFHHIPPSTWMSTLWVAKCVSGSVMAPETTLMGIVSEKEIRHAIRASWQYPSCFEQGAGDR